MYQISEKKPPKY